MPDRGSLPDWSTRLPACMHIEFANPLFGMGIYQEQVYVTIRNEYHGIREGVHIMEYNSMRARIWLPRSEPIKVLRPGEVPSVAFR